MPSPTVISVNTTGASEPTSGAPAGTDTFRKYGRSGAWPVDPGGLRDDRDGTRARGTRAQALLAYPSEHYPFWQTVRAQVGVAGWGEILPWGSLGEHLTLQGLAEIDCWVGDQLRLPDCTLAISGPRLIDPSIDAALGFAQAGKLMSRSGWCGFHLTVVAPGRIAAGDRGVLVPGPREIGIVELLRARAGRSDPG